MEAMIDAVRNELMRAASMRELLTYQQVAVHVGLSMGNRHQASVLAKLLCDIARDEHEQGRPLLSAIVVAKQTRQPGRGFFAFARKLDKHFDDDTQYFHEEVEAVWAHWAPSDL